MIYIYTKLTTDVYYYDYYYYFNTHLQEMNIQLIHDIDAPYKDRHIYT